LDMWTHSCAFPEIGGENLLGIQCFSVAVRDDGEGFRHVG